LIPWRHFISQHYRDRTGRSRPIADIERIKTESACMERFDAELGYKAMIRFLEKHFETTGSDDLGALLGSMSTDVFSDGRPADPAMWEDWLDALREVKSAG